MKKRTAIMHVLLFVCLLSHVVDSFVLVHNVERNVTSVLTVDNGDRWGDWGPAHFCAAGTFAVGYSMKIEPYQAGGDDTELNGIMLTCAALEDGRFGGNIVSSEGPWGTWDTGPVTCDHTQGARHFLTSFTLQVEPSQGGAVDDTGVNYIKFHCRDFFNNQQQYEIVRAPGQNQFGTYGAWSQVCGANSAICGLSTKVEPPQGGGDDTAIDDVRMYCCSD